MAYDWDYYKHKYVTGDVTLDHLASLPGSPALATLKRRSSTEDWSEQRKHYRDQTATKAREVASTTEAEVAARHAKIARSMIGKALQRLQTLDVSDMTAKDIREYIKDAADLERKALGLERTEHTGDVAIRIIRE